MSKHQIIHSQSRVLKDVAALPPQDLIQLYGIEIAEDGTVYDPTENQKFKSLAEWAEFVAVTDDENNYGSFNKIGGRHAFDDED
jgi:hypothetical protein